MLVEKVAMLARETDASLPEPQSGPLPSPPPQKKGFEKRKDQKKKDQKREEISRKRNWPPGLINSTTSWESPRNDGTKITTPSSALSSAHRLSSRRGKPPFK